MPASVSNTLPLFMRNHTAVDDSKVDPKETVDYVYNTTSQTADWISATTLWTPTQYTDTRADGYKHHD